MEDRQGRARRITRLSGSTPAERYLEHLCEKSFLSLWSYPRPHRDQDRGKEICDLLVVMGDDVIIFSDKNCEMVPKKGFEIDWARWFRAAVKAGARQAWGAERWLQQNPERVFLDRECTQPLPVHLPPADRARYHLVVTVHGVTTACRYVHGGSGSLMLTSTLDGLDAHDAPFVVGDLDRSRTFVHVLDDTSMDIVMKTLDTTPDFVRYLGEKEKLFRSRAVFATGEEDLLGLYLSKVDDSGQHAFVIDSSVDLVAVDETSWRGFARSPQRLSQLQEDRISYVWDDIIETFSRHALAGTQYSAPEPAFESTERVLRFMAAEPRIRRRYLSQQIVDAVQQTAPHSRRIRVAFWDGPDLPMYVFVLFPWRNDKSEETNRRTRMTYLEACVRVAKLKNPHAKDIIGLATESGFERPLRSEDVIHIDARRWGKEDDRLARELQRNLDILTTPKRSVRRIEEYPLERHRKAGSRSVGKNQRNKPCPCGRKKKFKHCHGSATSGS